MIRTAEKQDISGIKSLWQEAFGDSIAYINLLLSKGAEFENTLLSVKSNNVCGMLFVRSCELVFGAVSYQCAYFYAIAVRKENRGEGVATELLQHAYTLCQSRGFDVCVLVPASASLFSFYSKRGYVAQGYIRSLALRGRELEGMVDAVCLSSISCQEIIAWREEFFKNGYLAWNEKIFAFILEENKFLGGHFYKYKLKGEEGYISYLPIKDSLVVQEFVGKAASLHPVLKELHKRYQKQEYLCRLSATAEMGVRTPYAMTRWIRKGTAKPFYMAHGLD